MSYFAYIIVNSDCNNDCELCNQKYHHHDHQEMSFETFKDLILWADKIPQLLIFGGEPTLHPDFVKMKFV